MLQGQRSKGKKQCVCLAWHTTCLSAFSHSDYRDLTCTKCESSPILMEQRSPVDCFPLGLNSTSCSPPDSLWIFIEQTQTHGGTNPKETGNILERAQGIATNMPSAELSVPHKHRVLWRCRSLRWCLERMKGKHHVWDAEHALECEVGVWKSWVTEELSQQKPPRPPSQHLAKLTSKNPMGTQWMATGNLNVRNRIHLVIQEQALQRKTRMRMQGGAGCR